MRLIDLNVYLASFLGATFSDKVGVTKLNENVLNSTPNISSKQAYVQGFDCEYILFKKAVNMFEQMDISESIYKGTLKTYHKKPIWVDSNSAGQISNKRGKYASS